MKTSEVEHLEIGPRSYNCLKNAGLNTIEMIEEMPPSDWMNLDLGVKGRTEIWRAVERLRKELKKQSK